MNRPFSVDCGYLQEDDAFEVNQLLSDWPAADNVFLAQRARSLLPGATLQLQISDLVTVIGHFGLNMADGVAAEFELNLEMNGTGSKVDATYVAEHSAVIPPIEADNPGFAAYALSWFGVRRPNVRMYVMRGLFWVAAEQA